MRRLGLALALLGTLALAFVLLVPRRDAALAHWWIRDDAHLLTPAEELRLTRYHGDLLDTWDIDLRIFTTRDAYDLDTFAVETFADLGVGDRSDSGRGLLLAVDPAAGRVRLEVARELEGTYPDAFVAYVEHEQMAPFFAAGRVADGILATTELLVSRAGDPTVGLATDSTAPRASTSAGAGANVSAPIGSGYVRPGSTNAPALQAAATPAAAVAVYLAAMSAGDARPDLDIYTETSRAYLAGRVVTRAQMDNVVRTYLACGDGKVMISESRAVVMYPTGGPSCAPWLLARSADDRWRLDLATMGRALRFDTTNRWRLADPQAARDYAFAFGGST